VTEQVDLPVGWNSISSAPRLSERADGGASACYVAATTVRRRAKRRFSTIGCRIFAQVGAESAFDAELRGMAGAKAVLVNISVIASQRVSSHPSTGLECGAND